MAEYSLHPRHRIKGTHRVVSHPSPPHPRAPSQLPLWFSLCLACMCLCLLLFKSCMESSSYAYIAFCPFNRWTRLPALRREAPRFYTGETHASRRPRRNQLHDKWLCTPPQIATNTCVYREYTLEITDGNLHFAPYLLEHHPLPRLGLPWIFTVVFRSPRSILWDRDRPWCHRLPRYVAGHFAALDYTH